MTAKNKTYKNTEISGYDEEVCIICGQNKWFNFSRLKNSSSSVIICETCSLAKLYPVPSENDLKLFYKSEYRDKHSIRTTVDRFVIDYEQQRAERVLSVISPHISQNFSKVLDVGSSTGILLKNLKEIFNRLELYGIELNENYRKWAIENSITEESRLFNIDITDVKDQLGEKFQIITLVHVLEHLSNPLVSLKSIRSLLDKDGIFYVEVPNLKTPYFNLKTQYFQPYHLYNFSDVTLRLLLEKVGFEILEERQIARTSICFVCRPKAQEINKIEFDKQVINNKEFDDLLRCLNSYQKQYPITWIIEQIKSIMRLLGMSYWIKKIIVFVSKFFPLRRKQR